VAVEIRYEKNHADFGRLMMSDQTQSLADQGALRGLAVARTLAAGQNLPAAYISSIRKAGGPPVVLGKNPRRTARVYADMPFIEFGSGLKRKREQGGHSPAYRILGKAGARIGSPPGRKG
jgi:hypothetical protein